MINISIEGVVFDVDGVLFNTERLMHQIWHEVGAEMGWPQPDRDYLEFVGNGRSVIFEKMLTFYGPDFPKEEFLTTCSQTLQDRVEQFGVPLKPGVREILDFLKEQNIPIAIATSTAMRRTGKRMELTGELRKLLAQTDWLVETLLKISKLDAGTVHLTRLFFPVRQLIDRSAAPIAIPMELRNQTLHIQCKEEMLSCDLVWTAEALGNILKNCMEHTPDGGTITVTAAETALYTQIDIEDNGSGFDSKDIPHLFERFYKGRNACQSSYGIGLSLARTVITAQNGTVQAANTEKGAKFVIKFYKQVI